MRIHIFRKSVLKCEIRLRLSLAVITKALKYSDCFEPGNILANSLTKSSYFCGVGRYSTNAYYATI